MTDPAAEDPCAKVRTKHGTSTGTSAEYDRDAAGSAAESDALKTAAKDAEAWAMTIFCPGACLYKELEIEIGEASTALTHRGRDADQQPIWNGQSEVSWTATLKCIKAMPGDAGTVEADGNGVTVDGEHRHAKCGETVRAEGSSFGEGSSVRSQDATGTLASNEAQDSAHQQAYLDANAAALAIRCHGNCPKRRVTITTSEPKPKDPEKQTITMPGTLPGGAKKLLECWLVEAECRWKVRVTCHD